MKDQEKVENLLLEARSGNKTAEDKFYSHLTVRFIQIVRCEIERFSILRNEEPYIDKMCHKICQEAIEEIKILCPISHTNWSLIRAVHILHNITDDFIMNNLVSLAKDGNNEAENMLFTILRTKLIQRVETKTWKVAK